MWLSMWRTGSFANVSFFLAHNVYNIYHNERTIWLLTMHCLLYLLKCVFQRVAAVLLCLVSRTVSSIFLMLNKYLLNEKHFESSFCLCREFILFHYYTYMPLPLPPSILQLIGLVHSSSLGTFQNLENCKYIISHPLPWSEKAVNGDMAVSTGFLRYASDSLL